jgi:penicillin amidase
MEARDRLWQMEFQTHAAAGRLSEIIGPLAINYDRRMRRKGLLWAAQKMSEDIMRKDQQVASIIDAYARGVNAYIESLSPEDYPLEYKLLGYKPEAWTNLKSWLLLKSMSDILTGGADDIEYTQAWSLYGKAYAELMYPDRSYEEEPIISKDRIWKFQPVPKPPVPPNYRADSLLIPGQPWYRQDAIGSNNWAVHGSKAASGRPMLANDPHLSLSLPSVWYELQLSAPGYNCYGVSFPGTPCLIIGFNDSIAWGVTNGSQDVLDYYRIYFTDESRSVYYHGDTTLPVKRVIDSFLVKNGETVYDTLLFTHHGPVMYDRSFGEIPVPLAMRWTAHDPSNELRTFFELNIAQSYSDYKQALSHFVNPGQNFVFASMQGDVAITQQGKFPLRWEGQGKYILDGSNPLHDWQGYIPIEHNPAEMNPPRGYVSSTNQHPTTPSYPYYYTGFFAEDRSRRIAMLMQRDSLTVGDMKVFQTDNYNIKAQDLLPVLLSQLDSNLTDKRQLQVRDMLASWDYLCDVDAGEAVAHQLWENMIMRAIWRDELKDKKVYYPHKLATIGILRDSMEFKFYDDINTPEKETRSGLIRSTFAAVVDSLYKMNENPEELEWYAWKSTSIRHLLDRSGQFRSFSRMSIPIGGSHGVLNASGDPWGPSWRMIVNMGAEGVEAWGVYPGGQSGSPGSAHYDDFVDTWAAGDYYRLWFMQDAGEQDSMFVSKTQVQSGS